jgi:protein TonB
LRCLASPLPDPARDPRAGASKQDEMRAPGERTVILRCSITEEGRLEDCRVISKPSPYDNDVLAKVPSMRFQPVLLDGGPARATYTVTINVKPPPESPGIQREIDAGTDD